MQRQRTNCRRLVLILIATCLLSASINAHPGAGIAVDRLGQVYFLDTGSGLWKIDTRGALTHLSGTLFHWLAIDENNRFANTRLFSGALGEISKIGANPTVLISSDYPIAIGRDGDLYYPSGPAGNLRMMKMTPSATMSGNCDASRDSRRETAPVHRWHRRRSGWVALLHRGQRYQTDHTARSDRDGGDSPRSR